MDRKKKLRLYQALFLLIGFTIILITYYQKELPDKEKIISQNLKEKIDKQIRNQKDDGENVFYNVKYSGLDFEGNRYTILSKEAVNSDINENLVYMKNVVAKFYFKDDTIMDISSAEGKYNNKTLDMEFSVDVKASYEGSELFAEKAEFLNSENFLIVSNNVKILDTRGTMFADKLIFDIKDKTLNINSSNESVIKSKVVYK
tara:strand:- start:7450 stop:8055 length:606 start_codon:yes stop_codon:yes gene_type:complete